MAETRICRRNSTLDDGFSLTSGMGMCGANLGQNSIMAIVFVAALKKMKQTAAGEFDENSIREQLTKRIQADEQTGVGRLDRNILRLDYFCSPEFP
jgi:hypothetical protein